MSKLPADTCIGCGERSPVGVLRFEQVPVNSLALYATREEALQAVKADIDLAACRRCGLLFNRAFDSTVVDYDASYENSLDFSPTFRVYAEQLVQHIVSRYSLAGGRVLEIGSGKGEFLEQLCQRADCQGIGVDPTYDGSRHRDPRLTFIKELFHATHAYPPPDLLVCRQTLEHTAEPLSFLTAVADALGPQSTTNLIFEVPNAALMLEEDRLWELIYEHVSYSSPDSIRYLFSAAGFEVTDVQETFGRQFLLVEARIGGAGAPAAASQTGLLADVERFALDWTQRLESWRARFAGWRASGERVVVWGAGARGVTLLNVVADGADIAAVVDINPRKWGSFVAGTGHRVVAPDTLTALRPQLVVLTNSMYETEVKMMLKELELNSEVLMA